MKASTQRALEYVRNTNGGATRDHFVEDHEPIGELLFAEVESFIRMGEGGELLLNEKGEAALCTNTPSTKAMS